MPLQFKLLLSLGLFAAGLLVGWTTRAWFDNSTAYHAIQVQHTAAVKQQKKDVQADTKLSTDLTKIRDNVPKIITRIQRVNVNIPPTPDSCKPFDPLSPDWLREYDSPADTSKAG